jgi:hypothetical protein
MNEILPVVLKMHSNLINLTINSLKITMSGWYNRDKNRRVIQFGYIERKGLYIHVFYSF